MNPVIIVAKTTFPSVKTAEECIKIVLEKSLVACAQRGSEIVSSYVWQEKSYTETEFPVEFKTTIQCEKLLEAEVKKIHPYECPEWITYQAKASEDYFKWVEQNCKY